MAARQTLGSSPPPTVISDGTPDMGMVLELARALARAAARQDFAAEMARSKSSSTEN